jgi:excisionase family DNA binding protein
MTTDPIRRAVPPRCLTLLTVQEAADYASVSKQTVRRWIRAGDLRVLRAGCQIRIDESDLLVYLHRDADVVTTLSPGAVFPMSSEMQQAVADAMAATGAEAVPAGWRVFRPAGEPSERQSVAANKNGHQAPA